MGRPSLAINVKSKPTRRENKEEKRKITIILDMGKVQLKRKKDIHVYVHLKEMKRRGKEMKET